MFAKTRSEKVGAREATRAIWPRASQALPLEAVYQSTKDSSILQVLKDLEAETELEQGWPSERLHELLLRHPDDFQHLMKVLAFSQDNPSWLVLGNLTTPTRILIVGGGLGRQPEILASLSHQVVVLENCPVRRQFLNMRFRSASMNITILSYAQFLDSSKINSQFDFVHVRAHFLSEATSATFTSLMARVFSTISEGGELFVETSQRFPPLLMMLQRILPSSWMSHGEPTYDKSWWLSYLNRLKTFRDPEILYLSGPHWWSEAYVAPDKVCAELTSQQRSGFKRFAVLILTKFALAWGYIPLSNLLLKTTKIASVRQKDDLAHPTAVNTIGPKYPNGNLSSLFSSEIRRDALQIPPDFRKREHGNQIDDQLSRGYRISGNGIVSWKLEAERNEWNEEDLYIRTSVNQVGKVRLQRAHQALKHLNRLLPDSLTAVIPQSQQRRTDRLGLVYVEKMLKGNPLFRYDKRSADQVLAWLAKVHSGTLAVVHSEQESMWLAFGKARVAQIVETVERVLEWYGTAQHERDWAIVKPALLSPPFQSGLALCHTHGDLNPGNILIDRKIKQITGVIDWETTCGHWLPARDVYDVLVNWVEANYRKMPEAYRSSVLRSDATAALSAYLDLVPSVIRHTVTHPWAKTVFPFERLQTVFDGYDLKGVVTRDGWGDDLLRVLGYAAEYRKALEHAL